MPQRSALVRGRVDKTGQSTENLEKRIETRDPNTEPKTAA